MGAGQRLVSSEYQLEWEVRRLRCRADLRCVVLVECASVVCVPLTIKLMHVPVLVPVPVPEPGVLWVGSGQCCTVLQVCTVPR